MDSTILEQLIDELVVTSDMLVVIDSGGAVAEMHARGLAKPNFEDGWAIVEAEGWHVHLNMKTVDEAQFVEAEDNYHDFPKLYYVRFSDASGNTIIRFYFPNPWLDDNEKRTEFQPEKLKFFEDFRDRYVGEGGIVFVQR
ncbi:MAG: hypothetical protein IIB15_09040 [Chloroflexi bacterium]|nr:hypothetical protein [Chloroflexota bacterium]